MKPDYRLKEYYGAEDEVLKEILRNWLLIITDYNEQVRGDNWWDYSERPQIGFLAAATWKAGGTALEEWRTQKWDKRRAKYGRNDLWIRHKGRDFFIEARHTRINLDQGATNSKMFEQVEGQFQDAGLCVRRQELKRQKIPQRKIGIAFVSINSAGKESTVIEKLIEQLVVKLRPSLLAWKLLPHKDKTCGVLIIGKTTR